MEPEACGQQPHLLLPQQSSHSSGHCEQVAPSRCNPSPWEQQDPRVLCSDPLGSSLGLQLWPHNHQSTATALHPLISHLSAWAAHCTTPCSFIPWIKWTHSSFGHGSHHEKAAQSPSQGTQAQQQQQPPARNEWSHTGSRAGSGAAPDQPRGQHSPRGNCLIHAVPESLNTLTCSPGM